ncbi:Uncharacterised protein [Mycobacteroides abscessus subsp. abscessus]|nr:Uncharacterised protein [Mycobacteroides abscessus subsp. abscessus]
MQRRLGVLGGGISAAAVVHVECGNGRDGDDKPVAGVDQLGQQGAGHLQGSHHVGFPHPTPVFKICLQHRLQAPCAAGVVDQHIDPIQALCKGRNRIGVGDIEHKRSAPDFSGQRLDAVFSAGCDHYVESKSGKGFSRSCADSGTGAGDNRDPAVERGIGHGRHCSQAAALGRC